MWGPNLCAGWGMFLFVSFFGIGSSAILFSYLTFWEKVIITLFGYALVLFNLWKVETMDPGILPKAKQLPPGHKLLSRPDDPLQQNVIDLSSTQSDMLSSIPDPLFPIVNSIEQNEAHMTVRMYNKSQTQFVSLNNEEHAQPVNDDLQQVKIDIEKPVVIGNKFCHVCGIYRPSGCKHCYDCNNCVAGFDHHCPVVNNCIGQRNQGFFVGFLVSCSTTLWIYTGVAIKLMINLVHSDLSLNEQAIPMTLLLMVAAVDCSVSVPVFLFGVYHLYLLFTDQTSVGLAYNVEPCNQNLSTFYGKKNLYPQEVLV
eukprot:MONOS_8229.1-p1 / transcript=MONOS_8229.1 / gene=MONOS_8229 / organism=Monocercomonoides_exilis_PA203 / gene_product=unspecified product / transcript_product=unspecified product / location=Mono_scaffold00304:53925-55289(-) / protein_length=310 / sequence_SO=supercontig / SO=protein_coding / is_pseudo=false